MKCFLWCLFLLIGIIVVTFSTPNIESKNEKAIQNWGFTMFSIYWAKPGYEYSGDCHIMAMGPTSDSVNWNCTFFYNDTTPHIHSHIGKATYFSRKGSENEYTFIIGRNADGKPLNEWSEWFSSILLLPQNVVTSGQLVFTNINGNHWKCKTTGCQFFLGTNSPDAEVEFYFNT